MIRSLFWIIAMLLSLNSYANSNFSFFESNPFTNKYLKNQQFNFKLLSLKKQLVVDKTNNLLSVAGGNSASIVAVASGSNLTYQWQLSTDKGITYSNLSNGSEYSGVTNSTLLISIVKSNMQDYKLRCVVSDGSTSDFSGITTLNILASPLCSSNPTMYGYEYVSEVVINGVSIIGSTSFTDTRGYRDFTNIAIPEVTAGSSFAVSVTVKTNSTYQEYVKFWLDFDKNGVPGNNANELVFNQVHTFNGTHTYTGNINIPADALNGSLYARMIMQYAGSPNVCGTYSYGNTYDFKIPVIGGQLSQTLSVAVNKAGNSNGSVSSSPAGINTLTNTYSVNTLQGTAFTLTATPNAGSKFLGWSGAIESTSNPISFVVSGDMNILAKFAEAELPKVIIKPNEVLSSSSVNLFGEVTELGDAAVTDRGFVVSTSQNPTTSSGTKYSKGTGLGEFTHTLTGLNNALTYYVRAYAINSAGTVYSQQQTISLNKVNQTITASNVTATYGDASSLINASTDSSLPLTFTSSDNTIVEAYQDVADGNKWKLNFKKAGTATLTISQIGNDSYNSASKDISITIAKKAITITAGADQKKVYGEANPVYTYTVSPGLIEGDSFTGALSRAAGENVGNYDYTLGTLSAGANYDMSLATGSSFAITKKAITITAGAGQKKVYGEANPVYTYTVSPALISGDSFTGALSRAAGENVGNYDYTLGTLSAGANYEMSLATGSSFAITKKAITITAGADQKKVYGEANPVYTYTVSPGLIEGDSFTGALSRVTGENVGSYAYTLGTLSAGANYDMSLATGSFAITKKAITITAGADQKKVYGEANPVYTYTVSPALLGSDTFTGALSRVAGENAGNYAYTLGNLSAGANYDMSLATGSSFEITKKAITITAGADQKKVYGEANPVYTYTVSPGLIEGDSFTGALSRAAGENVGSYAFTLGTLSAGENYDMSLATGSSFAITKKAITITAGADQKKVYGEANPVYTYTVSPALISGDSFTGALSRAAGENVGNYAYTLGTLSAGANYDMSLATGSSFAITKKAITITAGADQKKVYGEANPVYTYTVSPGLIESDSFTGALSRVTGENVGSYGYTLGTLSAGGNYDMSLATGSSFTITKKAITITAGADQKKVYGEANPVYAYTVSPALISGDSFTGALSRITGENVGNYAYTLGTLSAGGNYDMSLATGSSFAITKKAITITAGADQKKVYGEANPVYTYTVSPALISGDSFTGALSRAAGENVGSYAFTLGTLSAGANYDMSLATGSSFAITKKAITITANADQKKIYGEANPVYTYTVSPGLIEGDSFTGALSRAASENVGSYAYTLGTLSAGANYDMSLATGSFTITKKAITITAGVDQKKIYGEANPVYTFTVSPALIDGDSFTGALSRAAGENVGSYAYTLGTLSAGANYEMSLATGSFAIIKKAITITANSDQKKVYGEANPVYTYTVSPALLGSDTFTGALSRAAGENVGVYAYTLGTLSAGANYDMSLATGSFAITKKAITITAGADQKKVYGEANPVYTYTVSPGLISGDSFTGSLSRAAGENVGSYAFTLGTLSAGANYDMSLATGGSFAITKKAITITAGANQKKVYGEANPVYTFTVSPALITGDSFTGALSRAAGENVGSYGYTLGTLSAGANYEMSLATGGSFTITKKAITITANADQKKIYGEANPVYTYTVSPGLIEGDSFTGALSRAAGENVGSYAYTLGTLSAGANYEMSLATGSFTITKKSITITPNADQKKVYGEANPVYTYTVSPALIDGDSFTGALSRAAGENVGSYAYTLGTLSAGANYEMSLATGSFAITKKAITITPNADQKKVYGEVNPVYTYTVSPGLIEGDSFTGALSRATGENVGSYAYTLGTLTAGANYEMSFVANSNFAIEKRPITVATIQGQFKPYGDLDPELTYNIEGMGLAFSDNFNGKLTRNAGENVGDYPISLGSVSISNNYELTFIPTLFKITPKTLNVIAKGIDKMYDGTTRADIELTDNRIGNDEITLTYEKANFITPNIGSNIKIIVSGFKVSGPKSSNYIIEQQEVSTLASISTRVVSVIANPIEKVYGDTDPVLTYKVLPELVNGDQIVGSLERETGENVGFYNIGRGNISLNSNYEINFIESKLNIIPKTVLITPEPKQKIYGDADPVLTYTHSPLLNNDNISGSLIREGGENAGAYAILIGSLKVSNNYKLTITPSSLTIEKALLKIKANNFTICEGSILPSFTMTYSGFKLNDNINSLSNLGEVKTNANRNSPAGTYNLIPSGAQSNNYIFEYENGLLTINKAEEVKITANTPLKVKSGTTITLTASGAVTYTWENSSGIISGQNSSTLIVKPTQNTIYTVNAINANGCVISSSISIEIIKEEEEIKDPIELVKGTNVITPNGDGKNDNLVIKNIELFPNNEIIIFDLAGRIVYRKKGYDNSWTGTLNGVPLAKGTYYYIIDFGDNKTKKKGFVSIVRN